MVEHLSQVPWLTKDVVWLVPDARCGLLPSVEVRSRPENEPTVAESPYLSRAPRLAKDMV